MYMKVTSSTRNSSDVLLALRKVYESGLHVIMPVNMLAFYWQADCIVPRVRLLFIFEGIITLHPVASSLYAIRPSSH